MRRLVFLGLVFAVALAQSLAHADRASNFTAQVVGPELTVNHDAKGWALHVDTRTLRVPQVPSTHGDLIVFASPARDRVAFVRVGDADGLPKAADTAVWIYATAGTGSLLATVPFSQLFTADEIAAIPYSTAGMHWQTDKPSVKDKRLTLTAWKGAPVVIDLGAPTATRKH